MGSMKKRNTERGFSLIELLVTVVIITIAFGFAVIQIVPALRSAHMDTASSTIQNQLRAARARAIAERGEVIVIFDSTGTMATTAPNIAGFVPVTVPLPSDVQFYIHPGLPNTPDNFKPAANAIDFDQNGAAGNSLKIRFEPNGSAIDDSGGLNNGAVYIAQTNNLNSQRAITLLGATARVRSWRIVLKNWSCDDMELNAKKSQSGFTLIEAVFAALIVTVALVSLLALFGLAMKVAASSRLDTQARDQAQQVTESIFAARNAGSLSFSAIQNVSTDPNGAFVVGYQNMFKPGADGVPGTTDDDTSGLQTDADGNPLSTMQRQIVIQPVPLATAHQSERSSAYRKYSISGFWRHQDV